MPMPDGKLSDAEVALAHERLKVFWARNNGRKPCPSCGHPHYYVIPQLNGNRSDTLATTDPHFRFPTVMVTCQQCGYLEQYLASNLGIQWLMPPPPIPAPPPPEQSLGEILSDALKRNQNNG